MARQNSKYFFAVDDEERIIGMSGYYFDEKKKLAHIANVVRVYVSPSHRGKGIGKKLLLTVIEDAKSKPEAKKIQLGVISTQTAAFNLYKSVGFKQVGKQKMAIKIDNKFYDKYLMEMLLDN